MTERSNKSDLGCDTLYKKNYYNARLMRNAWNVDKKLVVNRRLLTWVC